MEFNSIGRFRIVKVAKNHMVGFLVECKFLQKYCGIRQNQLPLECDFPGEIIVNNHSPGKKFIIACTPKRIVCVFGQKKASRKSGCTLVPTRHHPEAGIFDWLCICVSRARGLMVPRSDCGDLRATGDGRKLPGFTLKRKSRFARPGCGVSAQQRQRCCCWPPVASPHRRRERREDFDSDGCLHRRTCSRFSAN